MELLELDFQDLDIEDGKIVLLVEKNNFINIRDELKNKSYHVIDSAIHYIPDNTLSLDEEDTKQLDDLLENLEEDEDVDFVYSNVK
jgi:transcriptional/translational regulatory protein YebC/TACO1